MSCLASHVESSMTHSSRQTSITGWRDWYTHTYRHCVSFQLSCSTSGGIMLCFSHMVLVYSSGGSPVACWRIRRTSVPPVPSSELPCWGGKMGCTLPSGKLVFNLLLSCQWLYIQIMRDFFPISVSDSNLGEHQWGATLYASFGHPNVTCQVNKGAPLTVHLSYSLILNCPPRFYCVFLVFHETPGHLFKV